MKARIRIELIIEGEDALDVVDRLLDDGLLQDAINDYQRDEGPLRVLSASCCEVDASEPVQTCGRCGDEYTGTDCPRCHG